MRRPLLLVALLSIASAALVAQTPAAGSAEAAVRAVVERYLRGLKFNDTLSLREAFWPDARLFYVNGDTAIGQWTQASWYASFAGNVGKEEQGTLRIAAVDVTRDIAVVTVVEEYPRSRYIDYLSLLRVRGRWWIVNKVYTSERK